MSVNRKFNISDINSHKITEFMDPTVNRVNHKLAWQNAINGRTNLTADEILDIWRQVEEVNAFPNLYRSDDAVDIFNL